MAEDLPKKLQWMAREPAAFWCIDDPESYEGLAELLGVTTDEIDDLRADAIQRRRDVLIANAILLVKPSEEPIEEFYRLHDELYKVRQRLLHEGKDPDVARPRLSEAVAEALPEFTEANNASAVAAQRRATAHEVLGENGLEWNEDERRAKHPRITGLEQGNRPPELLTDVAVALAREWHDGGDVKLPKKLADRVSRAMAWFFQPSVLKTLEQRIRYRM